MKKIKPLNTLIKVHESLRDQLISKKKIFEEKIYEKDIIIKNINDKLEKEYNFKTLCNLYNINSFAEHKKKLLKKTKDEKENLKYTLDEIMDNLIYTFEEIKKYEKVIKKYKEEEKNYIKLKEQEFLDEISSRSKN